MCIRDSGLDGPSKQMDAQMQSERGERRTFRQRRHQAEASALPNGAIILEGTAKLIWGHSARTVTAAGYGAAEPRPEGMVTVLTPPTSLKALSNGYRPKLHGSAKIKA